MEVSNELAQDRRAWSATVRDVVNSIGDAGSTRPGGIPTQVQVSEFGCFSLSQEKRTWGICSWPPNVLHFVESVYGVSKKSYYFLG